MTRRALDSLGREIKRHRRLRQIKRALILAGAALLVLMLAHMVHGAIAAHIEWRLG